MLSRIQTFLRNSDGAVTVDWVVLAAAVVGLGVTSVNVVRNGTGNLAGDIRTSLENASVAAFCQGGAYEMRQLTGDRERETREVLEQLGEMNDEDLLNNHAELARKVQHQQDEGADQRDIDTNTDVFALFSTEIENRRLDPLRETPTVAELAGLTGACGDDGTGGSGTGGSGTQTTVAHDLVYYNDPRLEQDRLAYVDEFSRLDDRDLMRAVEEIDGQFHEALSRRAQQDSAKLLDLSAMLYQEAVNRGDPDTVTNARNRYDRAFAAWQEARF